MARLNLEQIARDDEDLDSSSTTSLNLSSRALSDVSCLASFRNLEKLDLEFNCLSSLEGLSSCANLKWLSVVENKLETLKGIECLSKLTVFNAGKNKLRKIDEISAVTSLRALILNDNNISSICKLDELTYLNTLVLSKNPIYDIGDSLMKAKSLRKLSLSHCHLERIGSSLTSCVELKELRLAHNKITTISAELARNIRLQNLDLGNNLIENFSELKVLSSLPNLKNLNFQGNPIAQKDKLAKKVKQLVPNLRIFNAKPTEINKRKKFSEEDKSDQSEIEADEQVKRKKSKKDVKILEKNISKSSSEEDHLLSSLSASKLEDKEGKRKKSKKNAKTSDKHISSGSIASDEVGEEKGRRKSKKEERENSREFEKEEVLLFPDINDLEKLPVDPLDYKNSEDTDREKKGQKVARGVFVANESRIFVERVLRIVITSPGSTADRQFLATRVLFPPPAQLRVAILIVARARRCCTARSCERHHDGRRRRSRTREKRRRMPLGVYRRHGPICSSVGKRSTRHFLLGDAGQVGMTERRSGDGGGRETRGGGREIGGRACATCERQRRRQRVRIGRPHGRARREDRRPALRPERPPAPSIFREFG
ncbi:uncharacterized protein A4U43_C02F7920 [Asparagus officinalis]|uniref:Protein phosphatase 1 regulatory subunit 7 n=1 Tax=Asparagus officinalis TaxID=4686 RepID=A0A5P1FHN2_ASPOF|nr:uncharacterized protein A4U43_C02F7920 [Asparagus officinalis]